MWSRLFCLHYVKKNSSSTHRCRLHKLDYSEKNGGNSEQMFWSIEARTDETRRIRGINVTEYRTLTEYHEDRVEKNKIVLFLLDSRNKTVLYCALIQLSILLGRDKISDMQYVNEAQNVSEYHQ